MCPVYSCNWFSHGILFRDIVREDPDLQGCIRYPLIGVYDAHGIVAGTQDVRDIGHDELKWADQVRLFPKDAGKLMRWMFISPCCF